MWAQRIKVILPRNWMICIQNDLIIVYSVLVVELKCMRLRSCQVILNKNSLGCPMVVLILILILVRERSVSTVVWLS